MKIQGLCNFGQLNRADRQRLKIPDLLTISETADALRVSVSKVYVLIAEGELEAFSLGRSKRVSSSAVLAYLDKCKI